MSSFSLSYTTFVFDSNRKSSSPFGKESNGRCEWANNFFMEIYGLCRKNGNFCFSLVKPTQKVLRYILVSAPTQNCRNCNWLLLNIRKQFSSFTNPFHKNHVLLLLTSETMTFQGYSEPFRRLKHFLGQQNKIIINLANKLLVGEIKHSLVARELKLLSFVIKMPFTIFLSLHWDKLFMFKWLRTKEKHKKAYLKLI